MLPLKVKVENRFLFGFLSLITHLWQSGKYLFEWKNNYAIFLNDNNQFSD